MATQADVRRIALSFPGTEESSDRFAFSVLNKGKAKGMVWVWMERIDPKKPRVPNPAVIAVRVASLGEKDLILSSDPSKFFTEPHYNGYPAVLVRLAAVTRAELRLLIEGAWRCQAPKELLAQKPAARASKARATRLLVLLVAAIGLACAPEPRAAPAGVDASPRADASPRGDTSRRADTTRRADTVSSPSPSQSPGTPQLVVTERGIGPLVVGMTFADASTALGGALLVPAGVDTTGCDYLVWRGGPRGVQVMFDEHHVARVDVDTSSIATAAGARVGDDEARIKRLYAGHLTVSPHKYEDGHYLTVIPAPADRTHRIVFETASGRVTRYRAGLMPSVEYVEGCS